MENGNLKYDKIKGNCIINWFSSLFICRDNGATMGELTFIKDGVATTIHDNGDLTILDVAQCDQCNKWITTMGGWSVRDHTGEVVMWLCVECRA